MSGPEPAALKLDETIERLGGGEAAAVVDDAIAALGHLATRAAATWAALGLAHEALDDGEARDQAYDEAIAALDASGTAPLPDEAAVLALVLVRRGRPHDALTLLDQVASDHPGDAAVAMTHAGVLDGVGDASGAADAYLRFVALLPWASRDQPIERAVQLAPDDAVAAALSRARLAEARDDPDAALAELATVIAGTRHVATARLERVVVLQSLGRIHEAHEDVRALPEELLDSFWPTLTLAALLTAEGDIGGALDAIDRAIRLDPGVAEAHRARANCLAQLGRTDEALLALERAVEIEPDNAPAQITRIDTLRSVGRLDEALRAADDLVAQYPDDAGVIGTRGQVFAALGRNDEALQAFDAAIAMDAGLMWVLLSKAETLQTQGDLSGSLELLDRVVAVTPELPDVRYSRGTTLLALGRAADAVAEFDATLAILEQRVSSDIARANAHAARGDALRLSERLDEALVAFETALTLQPLQPVALFGRGQIRGQRDDFEGAAADLDQAAAVARELGDANVQRMAFAWLGETRRRAGDLPGALEALDASLEVDPGYAFALGTRGQVHAAAGRRAEAIADLRAAVELADLDWACLELGEQLRLDEQPEQALEALDRAVTLGLDSAYLHGTRGQVLSALGRRDEALAEFRKGWELGRLPWIGDELAGALAETGDRSDLDEALTVLEPSNFDGSLPPDLLRRRADLLRLANQSKEGLEAIDEYLVQVPDDAAALATRAHLLADLLRPDEALALATELLDRDASNVFAAYAQIRALTMLDRHTEALAHVETLAQSDSSDTWLAGTRIMVLAELGRFDEALALATASDEPSREHAFMDALVGYCERRIEPPRLDAAVTHLRNAWTADPSQLWYGNELGEALRMLDDPEHTSVFEAVEALAADLDPSADTSAQRGWAQIRLGHGDEAVNSYQDAVHSDPSSLAYRFGLAFALVHAGRFELGSDEYEGASDAARERPDPARSAALLRESLTDLVGDRSRGALAPLSTDDVEATTAVDEAETALRAAIELVEAAAAGLGTTPGDTAPGGA